MDRHKYVKIAYHGFREISKEEKIKIYGATPTRESFDEVMILGEIIRSAVCVCMCVCVRARAFSLFPVLHYTND